MSSFKACDKKIQEVISKMGQPKIVINSKEVSEKQSYILDIFKCAECEQIPVEPVMECTTCDSIYCRQCIYLDTHELKKLELKEKVDAKCKTCMSFKKMKTLNRRLKHMTQDKLTFHHTC